LDVTFKNKNIADVLNMPIAVAVDFFVNQPRISRHMQTLVDVGLGYVRLGQPAPTLSGGEAQRVKLAAELAKRGTGHTIYLLDEPTTGLHFEDVRRLLTVLARLVDQGNTVLVIEHNLDVIKTADWLLDMGPEGGSGGGKIIAEGTPEAVAKIKGSYTGKFLAPLLK
jgi:excinuclease ABC subunit A